MSVSQQAKIIDGRRVAEQLLVALCKDIDLIKKAGGVLSLATVCVGQNKDVLGYSQSIDRLCKRLSIEHVQSVSPESVTQEELFAKIETLNEDPAITGILLFSPLPKHLNANQMSAAIDTLKDIEGRRAIGIGAEAVYPPTALSAICLLDGVKPDIAGMEAVVVGHSDIVGKPIAVMLMDRMATVTVCHIKTRQLEEHLRRADIIISAAGKANLIKAAQIKLGAIVIDVGENYVDQKIVGDVEFDKACHVASFITPVPGGVGPLTNVMLIRNLIALYRLSKKGQ